MLPSVAPSCCTQVFSSHLGLPSEETMTVCNACRSLCDDVGCCEEQFSNMCCRNGTDICGDSANLRAHFGLGENICDGIAVVQDDCSSYAPESCPVRALVLLFQGDAVLTRGGAQVVRVSRERKQPGLLPHDQLGSLRRAVGGGLRRPFLRMAKPDRLLWRRA